MSVRSKTQKLAIKLLAIDKRVSRGTACAIYDGKGQSFKDYWKRKATDRMSDRYRKEASNE